MKKIMITVLTIISLTLLGITAFTQSPDSDTVQYDKFADRQINETGSLTIQAEENKHESTIYKPSSDEITKLDIPLDISDGEIQALSQVTNNPPELISTSDSEMKNIRAWYSAGDYEILVSETVYHQENNITEFTNLVKSWFPEESMEELMIKGNPAILHDDSGICELQIITNNKLFTVASADRETILYIADKINF